jgi:deoxycytidine triphosphate deaminase
LFVSLSARIIFVLGWTPHMIVGADILARGLVTGGTPENLKNSTYDLTVGEIIAIGKDAVRARVKAPLSTYFLEPREMVWVLSKEEFDIPNNVTGFATLRTTFTKQGILALNVGIIDAFFRGPISTALINFSDRPRRIDVGDKFFRVAFFEHADVSTFHTRDESVERSAYVKELETSSFSDFAPSFLNIPTFDDKYYENKLWGILYSSIIKNKYVSFPLISVTVVVVLFLFDLGFWTFLTAKYGAIADVVKKIKFW